MAFAQEYEEERQAREDHDRWMASQEPEPNPWADMGVLSDHIEKITSMNKLIIKKLDLLFDKVVIYRNNKTKSSSPEWFMINDILHMIDSEISQITDMMLNDNTI